ncbi:hypothetical protein CYMTET_20774 [Cymbomonas tetramitiformis]|uniref:K Homology domain-containing protein n=1 Tax=Cymbomonas tetramitiformis TaxID=36881 RepID=A0AAE0FPI5_9CHLO|nr:hypothetical protein CYMTET_27572 [Cymbomonas tetramitiformis]KAK3270844.1 hypothetical protein CYMTET_20774 [Cymbomonas tetramitiformis]
MPRSFDYDPSYFHAHDGYPRGWYSSRYPPPRSEYYSDGPYEALFEEHDRPPKRRRPPLEDRRAHDSKRIATAHRFASPRDRENVDSKECATECPPGTNVYEFECDIPKDVSPGLIIGTGGRNLRDIQGKGVDVHVSDEGSIYIKSHDAHTFDQAKSRIRRLLKRITRKKTGVSTEPRDISGSASPTDDG